MLNLSNSFIFHPCDTCHIQDMFTVVLITFDMRWMQALIFPSTLPMSSPASLDSTRDREKQAEKQAEEQARRQAERLAEKERDRDTLISANSSAQLSVSQTILPSEKSLHSSGVTSVSGPATLAGSEGPDSAKTENSSGRSYNIIL